jgi:hypothetical protein
MIQAPGLTPTAVFENLATIQMVEVCVLMLDDRWLVLPRHTQPEKDVQAVPDQIRITLPSQHHRHESRPRRPPFCPCQSPSVSLLCGEDLSYALTESEGLSWCKSGELRKPGQPERAQMPH